MLTHVDTVMSHVNVISMLHYIIILWPYMYYEVICYDMLYMLYVCDMHCHVQYELSLIYAPICNRGTLLLDIARYRYSHYISIHIITV